MMKKQLVIAENICNNLAGLVCNVRRVRKTKFVSAAQDGWKPANPSALVEVMRSAASGARLEDNMASKAIKMVLDNGMMATVTIEVRMQ